MEIAFISDVHSNKIALNAVLSDIESKQVDTLICLGDTVGYNTWPSECLETVQNQCDIVLQGNHDRNVSSEPIDKWDNNMAYEGLKYSAQELTQSQKDWLNSLPPVQHISFDGIEFVLAHSHPTVEDKYVYPSDFARMNPIVDDSIDCVVLGHTHIQHSMELSDIQVVNPGSVGQPRDDTNNAKYATFDTETENFTLHSVQYDVESVVSAVKESQLPDKTGTRLL